jgi:sugar lactone lactonase YvrE
MVINRFVGDGTEVLSGDGGSALQAQLRFPSGVTVAPDGTVFIADGRNRRIRRVGTDGIITIAAQGGLTDLGGLALDPDGSLYIADSGSCLIRKLSPSGMMTSVAGTECNPWGEPFGGDGGPATQAKLN